MVSAMLWMVEGRLRKSSYLGIPIGIKPGTSDRHTPSHASLAREAPHAIADSRGCELFCVSTSLAVHVSGIPRQR